MSLRVGSESRSCWIRFGSRHQSQVSAEDRVFMTFLQFFVETCHKPSKFSSREPTPAWRIGSFSRFCEVSEWSTRGCSRWTSGSSSACLSKSFASSLPRTPFVPLPSPLRSYLWSALIVHQRHWSPPHLWSRDLYWAGHRPIELSPQFPRRKRLSLQLRPGQGLEDRIKFFLEN